MIYKIEDPCFCNCLLRVSKINNKQILKYYDIIITKEEGIIIFEFL